MVRKLTEAGIMCDVVLSEYPGHIADVAFDLAATGFETVIACGGDGTINEVINGIAGTNTVMGIVPLGTANDFAANMAISKNIKRACAIIKQRQVKKIDVVRINNDKFFVGTACLGFDAEIAAFASRRRNLCPFLTHVLGGMVKYISYSPKTVDIRFEDQKYFGDIFLVAFGNIKTYAKGMKITPKAVPDDALLDICLITRMPKWKLPFVIPSVYKGTHAKYKGITMHQAEAVYVQTSTPMDLYADGDFMTTTPFRLNVVPRHLNVIVGPDGGKP